MFFAGDSLNHAAEICIELILSSRYRCQCRSVGSDESDWAIMYMETASQKTFRIYVWCLNHFQQSVPYCEINTKLSVLLSTLPLPEEGVVFFPKHTHVS